jgi:serine/threonine protein kinase
LTTGAFGEVRMCVHRETGAQRAVKVLRKSHMDEDEKKMLFNEISILRELVGKSYLSDSDRITLTLSECTSSSRTRSATTLSQSKIFIETKYSQNLQGRRAFR